MFNSCRCAAVPRFYSVFPLKKLIISKRERIDVRIPPQDFSFYISRFIKVVSLEFSDGAAIKIYRIFHLWCVRCSSSTMFERRKLYSYQPNLGFQIPASRNPFSDTWQSTHANFLSFILGENHRSTLVSDEITINLAVVASSSISLSMAGGERSRESRERRCTKAR